MIGEFAYRGVSFEVTHAEQVDLFHGRAKRLYVALPISVSASTMHDLLRGMKAAVDDYKAVGRKGIEHELDRLDDGLRGTSPETEALLLGPEALVEVPANENRAAASA